MCGIAGFMNSERVGGRENASEIAASMISALRHRGPDDSGTWASADGGVALANSRLAILDLSSEGHQPMISSTGRYVLVFNGEIYNFRDVRRQLELAGANPGAVLRGTSDTEVMLLAFECWGIRGAVERFNGMFAFAVWDTAEELLHVVRDRLGEKPLYFGWEKGLFLFGSELKALRAHPGFKPQIDRNAFVLYLRYGYVPSGYSIYEGIRKLPPGTMATIDRRDPEAPLKPVEYWSAYKVAARAARHPLQLSEEAAADQLEVLLRDSVRLRMISDVPIGAFLSGGVDSSTVVALMQQESHKAVRTFSIGFHEQGFDEAAYAASVARHLGTEHTQLYVTSADAMAVIPRLPTLYDEPFADSSQIPTFLVAQLAKQHVTVALSGDGGDELFGGYNRYFLGRNIWRSVGWLPRAMRQAASALIRRPSPRAWERAAAFLSPLTSKYTHTGTFGEQIGKLGDVLAMPIADDLYFRLVSHWTAPETIALSGRETATRLDDPEPKRQFQDFTDRMMVNDLMTYLPDDILTKVDRASMGVSLEARVPLLDHRLVEFAWALPRTEKIRGREGKRLLRRVLYRHVPQSLIERPKSGFGIPIGEWLRGPLRDWAESLLSETRLREEGFFHPEPIRRAWNDHLAGHAGLAFNLWTILIFQSWLEEQR
jgi:asparagine synthase (glutamine-hydrolysing)